MLDRICCPTCSMSAAASDHRQFAPLGGDHAVHTRGQARRCRNCGETIIVAGARAVALDAAALDAAALDAAALDAAALDDAEWLSASV